MLSPAQTRAFLARPVAVQEKLDGLNVGFRFAAVGRPLVLSRVFGALAPEQLGQGLETLAAFCARAAPRMWSALGTRYAVFGEWMLAHTGVRYRRLPDAFVAFDVLEVKTARDLPLEAAGRLCTAAGLTFNAPVFRGRVDDPALSRLTRRSRFGDGPAEGVVLTRATERAKWVRKDRARARSPRALAALDVVAQDSPHRAERLRL